MRAGWGIRPALLKNLEKAICVVDGRNLWSTQGLYTPPDTSNRYYSGGFCCKMKESYLDILSRIDKEPIWFDQNGTPRYDEFHPDYCPNIYANLVVLMRISCQACGRIFDVELHYSPCWGSMRKSHPPKKWHYGDPPSHGCVGDSMNCEDIEVLQAWMREGCGDWKRHLEFEGLVE